MIDPVLQVDWPLEELWGDTLGFIVIVVMAFGLIGLASRSMTVAALGAYSVFAYFAIYGPDITILQNVLYVSLAVVALGLGFKFIRTEVRGSD